MILKNKYTKKILEISYPKFRKKFVKEIEEAFQSFKQTELSKTFFNYPDDNMLESNFYFSLRYNFNSFGNSAWYIENL